MSARFVVCSISGWSIGPRGGSNANLTTSFWIADTAYCWREVGRYYSRSGASQHILKRQAYERCDELNAWAEAVAA